MTCCREADDRSSVRWQQFICPVFVLFFLPLRIFTGFFLAFMRKMRGCEVLNSGLLRCIILSYTKKSCVLFLHVFRWSEISHAFALKFVKCHFVSWAKVRLSSFPLQAHGQVEVCADDGTELPVCPVGDCPFAVG